MILLGFHLRHGFWSAFHTIGLLDPRLRPLAYSAGAVFAIVIAVAFLVMPIYLYALGRS
jgi:succinate dehydrogenase / fumarate reductase cytochrome b subunit